MTEVPGVAEFLVKQGWAGIMVLVMLVAIIWLWRDNINLRGALTASQQARVTDAKEMTDRVVTAINAVTSSVMVLTELVRALGKRR